LIANEPLYKYLRIRKKARWKERKKTNDVKVYRCNFDLMSKKLLQPCGRPLTSTSIEYSLQSERTKVAATSQNLMIDVV